MLLLLVFAFISGLVTILAPCIWPILPIVLSASSIGGRLRPLAVSLGICVAFAVFLLTISSLVKVFNIDPNIFRLISVVIIGVLGLSLVIPQLSNIIEGFVSRLTSSIGLQKSGNGVLGGFITGLSLGLVWAPCAGPILATIATLASSGKISFDLVLITIAYVFGVGIPLLILGYGGQKIVQETRGFSAYTGRIQQIFGVVMILTAIVIYTNYDKVLQVKLLDLIPQYSNFLNNFESNPKIIKQLELLKGSSQINFQNPKALSVTDMGGLPHLGEAPEFVGITKWLNSEKPLSLKDLKGKVVLVDFWTYTCINCIRTLPHVTGWYDKYKDQGFIVVGVHSPEFEFEKNTENVLNAISQNKIHYPVAQDNNFETWTAYSNRYWPAEYLIDANGNLRHTHFGEKGYDETEKAIQELLKEANSNKDIPSNMLNVSDQTPTGDISLESYIGSARNQFIYPDGQVRDGTQNFSLVTDLPINRFSLGGEWTINSESGISGKSASLDFNFNANKVYLVIHPPEGRVAVVKVMVDGKAVDQSDAGDDVKNGVINASWQTLYNLINLQGKKGNHLLHLDFLTPDTEIFAFTFG